ncbi:hypothetical protein SLS64_012656 [Diaporthe eres]|uniref:F-box domain-containing protein n=1 Tax=Diaporthe eres TaxID=83184 RepID=A0ABR1NTN7_DIAER
MKHDALRPALPSIQLALRHVDSDDYFQQLLSIDSALEALDMSRNTLVLTLQDAIDQGLTSVDEAIKGPIAELESVAQRFKKLQTAARNGFNLRARSLRKDKVGIMDLPNELLLKIFDNLKWRLDDPNFFFFFRGDHDAYRPAIQNVRLTCRLFLQMSSHLLVRRLDISPSVSSLAHLEEVTRHPEIPRGERLFRIDLRYYSAAIARDLQAFAVMCDEKLRERIKNFETLIRFSDQGYGASLSPEARKNVEDGLVRARRILSSWEPFTNGMPIEEGASLNAAALTLQRGHEHYRELFQQQQEILRDGYFARTVAEAAARSGSDVWLSMSDTEPRDKLSQYLDEDFEDGPSDLDLFADPDVLVQTSLIQTQAWWRAEDDEAREIPQSLLYELPLAMRTTEARLAGVAVNISHPCKLNLRMSQDQRDGLSEVAEGLVAFIFRMNRDNSQDSEGTRPSIGEMTDLYAYLRAAMGPQSVPILWVSLPSICGSDDGGNSWGTLFRFPIGPLLGSTNWHRLRFARFEHLRLRLLDLEKLMGMLESEVRFQLKDIYLKGGTWAAALDCLRSKAAWGSDLLLPNGADCRRMTDVQYSDIFDPGDQYGQVSKATQYITSVEGVTNPCRRSDEAIEANPEP